MADTLVVSVASPLLWSAEHPNLYRLVLELVRPDGEVIEILGSAVGFRDEFIYAAKPAAPKS